MNSNARPKRAFIAYCVLAEKLATPGTVAMQALIPFLAEACQHFAGQLFDAEKFSFAVEERYGIRIPRLAALGLAEQLSHEGILTVHSRSSNNTVIYQYAKVPALVEVTHSYPVTEAEVEAVLASFFEYCKTDVHLKGKSEQSLESAFLDRLLNLDSMRILSRREASISAKRTVETIVLKKETGFTDHGVSEELHLDYLVSQFLIDLRDNDSAAFEKVSNVAFANMAAEAIACFQDPPSEKISLSSLTVYFDSPLLLDMLGVNTEYMEYGRELLTAIKTSGASPAVFDHCIAEAEAAIHAQLSYLRSGVNQYAVHWGTNLGPDRLAALSGNVAEMAEKLLNIAVHRDPEIQLHKRSPSTVGDIEVDMNNRMQAWRNSEAKEYDRKSVWAMLSIRDTSQLCARICDSKSLLLTRNTPLVGIANDAWKTWLKGSTKHSVHYIDRWTPVAITDKQFAGYLWARSGGSNGAISRARLLAHCSAAVRPRADVKARAYNMLLELNGREDADMFAALLEDREGAKALMRVTSGDPEDVTRERIPFILDKVKLAAGEYAAAKVREEHEKFLQDTCLAYDRKMEEERIKAESTISALVADSNQMKVENLQKDIEQQELERRTNALCKELDDQRQASKNREIQVLKEGLIEGAKLYCRLRWEIAMLFGVSTAYVGQLATGSPILAVFIYILLSIAGFWFVPDLLDKPLNWLAMQRLRSVVIAKDASITIPIDKPSFKSRNWVGVVPKP